MWQGPASCDRVKHHVTGSFTNLGMLSSLHSTKHELDSIGLLSDLKTFLSSLSLAFSPDRQELRELFAYNLWALFLSHLTVKNFANCLHTICELSLFLTWPSRTSRTFCIQFVSSLSFSPDRRELRELFARQWLKHMARHTRPDLPTDPSLQYTTLQKGTIYGWEGNKAHWEREK